MAQRNTLIKYINKDVAQRIMEKAITGTDCLQIIKTTKGDSKMKNKWISLFLAMVMALTVAGCSSSSSSSDSTTHVVNAEAAKANGLETNKIRVAYIPSSGHVFTFIAEDRGFFAEEGLTVERVPINASTDAFASLYGGQVDVLLTYGTSGPLTQLAGGEDIDIFGGYMITGETPIVARPGTGWKGITDLKGKKLGWNKSTYMVNGPMKWAGIDLDKDVKFISLGTNMEKLEAIKAGEIDYAVISTGHETIIRDMGLEIVAWTDEIWPNHSCCRMATTGKWLDKNPNAAKALLRAMLRGQEVYETEIDYAVKLTAEKLDVTEEYSRTFLTSPHLGLNLDPFKNTVQKVWKTMLELKLITPAASINVDDHINTTLYKEALDENTKKYPGSSKFYTKMQDIFAKNNT